MSGSDCGHVFLWSAILNFTVRGINIFFFPIYTVKGVNYYGPHSEYIVSGSDCGHVFLWDRDTERIVNFFHADEGGVVNVLEPHPHMPLLATSGLDNDVKLFMPTAQEPATLKGLAKVTRGGEGVEW